MPILPTAGSPFSLSLRDGKGSGSADDKSGLSKQRDLSSSKRLQKFYHNSAKKAIIFYFRSKSSRAAERFRRPPFHIKGKTAARRRGTYGDFAVKYRIVIKGKTAVSQARRRRYKADSICPFAQEAARGCPVRRFRPAQAPLWRRHGGR